jgi:hypothetical protein
MADKEFPFKIYKIFSVKPDEQSEKNKPFVVIFTGDLDGINGIHKTHIELTKLYKDEPTNKLFKNIINDKIKKNKPSVFFSKYRIHSDDTIEVVKSKFLDTLKNTYEIQNIPAIINEVYFSIQSNMNIDPKLLYNLRPTNSQMVSWKIINNVLLNLNESAIKQSSISATYDDIMNIPLFKNKSNNTTIDRPLLHDPNKIPIFVTNPFHNEPHNDSFYSHLSIDQKYINQSQKQMLMFEFGSILDETMYSYFAEDVMTDAKNRKIPTDNIIKIYFPLLFSSNISDLKNLSKGKPDDFESILSGAQIVDIMQDIYLKTNNDRLIPELKTGISDFIATIQQSVPMELPIDAIFKIISSSKQTPIIKYTPTIHKSEKIFRLYANKMSTNGKKIPIVQKSLFTTIEKLMSNKPSVSFYTIVKYDENVYNFIFEWHPNGNIKIIWVHEDLGQIIHEKSINLIIKKLDTIISMGFEQFMPLLSNFLQKNGHDIYKFNTILDESHIVINKMSYTTSYKITKKYDFANKNNECIKKFFIINPSENKKAIKKIYPARYTRVSNYVEKNNMDAMIVRLINEKISSADVIVDIINQYKFDREKAKVKDKTNQDQSDIEQATDLYRSIHDDIKNKSVNSGATTTIEIDNSNFIMKICDLDNINYLYTIPKYIDSIIQISQNVDKIDNNDLQKICKRPISITKTSPISPKTSPKTSPTSPKTSPKTSPTSPKTSDSKPDTVLNRMFLDANFEFSDSESEDEISGGTTKKDNYRQGRIRHIYPELFESEQDEPKSSYSRICSAEKQPIILTTEEKDNIMAIDEKRDTKEKIFNLESDIIGYTPPGKTDKHHYICPEYWCTKTETPMTKAEIERGDCKNIGDKQTKVNIDSVLIKNKKEDNNEKNKKEREEDNKKRYVANYKDSGTDKIFPGFSKNNTKPGLCIPCCFKRWDTTERMKMRDVCSDKTSNKSLNKSVDDIYITAQDKLTVDANRWSFVPNIIQQAFNHSQDTSIRKNMNILLRRGVEHHNKQSFVACIANILFFGLTKEDGSNMSVPTIVEMKEKIKGAITLDSFMTYQNGNLIESFQTGDDDIDISKYKDSTLYKSVQTDNKLTLVLKRTIGAYENFLNYLKDDTIEIDYKWLWDIIVTPNDKLFKNGINLVIFDISKNANTDDIISIICPSNVYSNYKYNPKYKTCFILKQDQHFTPIYYYIKTDDHDISFIKVFNEKKSATHNFIAEFISNVAKPILEKECNAKSNHQYTNVELINIMKKDKYTDIIQVLNFQGKVVGVHAKKSNIQGMIPCFPSALINTFEFVYIDDESIFHSYKTTLAFISEFYKENKQISKIVDDKQLVVGFLVNNQFIKLAEKIDRSKTSNDHLEEIITKDVSLGYEIDDQMTDKTKDSKREKFINTIRLETSMYKYFRNTLRILLNDYANIDERKQIISIIQSDTTLYSEQMKKINNIIKKLMTPHIIFTNIGENIDMLNKLVNSNQLCDGDNNAEKSCIYTHVNKDQKVHGIIISKKNLITNKDNDKVYFNRISDELLRFNHVNQFLLTPYAYQMFENVSTNIHDNEMIVFGNTISQDDIFSNLTPIKSTPYENPRPFDIMRPFSTVKVQNKFDLNISSKETEIEPETETENNQKKNYDVSCAFDPKPYKMRHQKWKNKFPKSYEQISYFQSNDCGWKFMIDIINKYKQIDINKKDLVDILVNKYRNITNNFGNPELISKLFNMFNENNHTNINILNKFDIELFILEDTYHVSLIDMWILFEHYEIPSMILFEPKVTMGSNYKYNLIISYKPPGFELNDETLKNNTSFEWIYASTPLFGETIVRYKYIVNTDGDKKVTRLPSFDSTKDIPNMNFDTFFNTYTKSKSKSKSKTPTIIDFSSSEIQTNV